MACSCHGKKGAVVDRKVPPDDQCTTCATKHINMAMSAWGEFTYEDDSRLWAAGHIRLAVEHLKIDHREEALELRDIATLIEENKDKDRNDVQAKLRGMLSRVRALMFIDHPEMRKRAEGLEHMEVKKPKQLPTPQAKDDKTYVFKTWPHLGDRAAAAGALWNLSRAYPDIKWAWHKANDGLFSWHENPKGPMDNPANLAYDLQLEVIGARGNLVECYTSILAGIVGKNIPLATRVPHMPEVQPYPGLPKDYIVLMAGYEDQCQAKAWPWWRELSDLLISKGRTVVRVGQAKFGQHTVDLPNAIDLYNKTSERELLSVLAHASCVVGPPSGAVHIASGYGVKSVCISGAREPAKLLDYPNCTHVASYNCLFDSNMGCIAFSTTDGTRNPCKDVVEYPCGWKCGRCMGNCPPDVVCAVALSENLPDGWREAAWSGAKVVEPADIFDKHALEYGAASVSVQMEEGRPELQLSGESAEKVDIIIPLGNGSYEKKNDELRILLRSVDRNLDNVGRVFLATKYCPDWINRDAVTVVDIDDVGCKDAALIRKVITVIDKQGIDGRFIFAADDNVIMQHMDASKLVNLSAHWGLKTMHNMTTTWMQRLMKTLRFFRDRGELWPYEYSFETHTPQIFDAAKLKIALKDVDYADNCFTITTLFRGLLGDTKEFIDAGKLKWTFYRAPRKEELDALGDRWFVGYNDEGFKSGLRDRLFELFPDKSGYEI